MNILILLQSLWIVLILFLSFYKFKYGLACYLLYMMLVPFMQINFAGITLQWNFVNIIVLAAFVKECINKKYKVSWRPFIPFVVYFLFFLVLMLFQDDVPYSHAINRWRLDVMNVLVVPFLLWNVINRFPNTLKLYRNTMIIAISIASLYGLFLTTMPGMNPYVDILSVFNGAEFNEKYAAAEDTGRLFGRISSVYVHPMTFGLVLGLGLIYIYCTRYNQKKYFTCGIVGVIILDILFCGVRTVIAAISIAVAYFFMVGRKYKLMLGVLLLIILSTLILPSLPDLDSYLGSLTDLQGKNETVQGSSLEMRLYQFNGCLKEIQNCPFVGKGYNWNGYYQVMHGDHPVILAFESLIFMVVCNSGFIGVCFWAFFIMYIHKTAKKICKNNLVLLDTLLVFYVSYSIITGDYGYMAKYVLFYTLILAENNKKKLYNGK